MTDAACRSLEMLAPTSARLAEVECSLEQVGADAASVHQLLQHVHPV